MANVSSSVMATASSSGNGVAAQFGDIHRQFAAAFTSDNPTREQITQIYNSIVQIRRSNVGNDLVTRWTTEKKVEVDNLKGKNQQEMRTILSNALGLPLDQLEAAPAEAAPAAQTPVAPSLLEDDGGGAQVAYNSQDGGDVAPVANMVPPRNDTEVMKEDFSRIQKEIQLAILSAGMPPKPHELRFFASRIIHAKQVYGEDNEEVVVASERTIKFIYKLLIEKVNADAADTFFSAVRRHAEQAEASMDQEGKVSDAQDVPPNPKPELKWEKWVSIMRNANTPGNRPVNYEEMAILINNNPLRDSFDFHMLFEKDRKTVENFIETLDQKIDTLYKDLGFFGRRQNSPDARLLSKLKQIRALFPFIGKAKAQAKAYRNEQPAQKRDDSGSSDARKLIRWRDSANPT